MDRKAKRGREENKDMDVKKRKLTIPELKNLSDFINAIAYNLLDYKYVNVNILSQLIFPLIKLDSLVGMKNLKNEVMRMIMYYLQGFANIQLPNGSIIKCQERMNCVILGPPGAGKTTVANILAEIYACMGVVSTSKVKIVRRTDFIAKYLGQTEHKTMQLLEECRGGVMFIDEAYNMSNGKDADSYSRAALDILNQFITENNDFVCIIAGYESELNDRFFALNPGLERRFSWRFTIDEYSPDELLNIFQLKVRVANWGLKSDAIDKSFFEAHKSDFTYLGGDIETFFLMCKIEHAHRVFGKETHMRWSLTNEDITNGYEKFMKHKKIKNKDIMLSMYM